MKKDLIVIIFIVIQIIGCTGAKFVKFEKLGDLEYKTEKKDIGSLFSKTNPRFLDNVIKGLNIPNNLFTILSTNDLVVVQSIDRNYQSDTDLQLVVQRGIISKLLNRNIQVLERDYNIILTLLGEASIQNNINNFLRAYSNLLVDSLNECNLSSKLREATKIFAYRVLEFGYIVVPSKNLFERIGIIEMEIRLIDAISSKILFIDNIRNIYTDKILKEEFEIIDELHPKFVTDALPLVKQEKSKDLLSIELEKKEISGIGKIKITFLKGDLKGNVKIKNSLTDEVVKQFTIPSIQDSPGELYFEYEFNLVNSSGRPLETGTYLIYLDNEIVYSFEI